MAALLRVSRSVFVEQEMDEQGVQMIFNTEKNESRVSSELGPPPTNSGPPFFSILLYISTFFLDFLRNSFFTTPATNP